MIKYHKHTYRLISLIILVNMTLSASAQSQTGINLSLFDQDSTRIAAAEKMIALYKSKPNEVTNDLILILQSKNSNDTAIGTACYICGKLSIKKSIPALISVIGRNITGMQFDLTDMFIPPDEALIMIGKPASSLLKKHLNRCVSYDEFFNTARALQIITKQNNTDYLKFLDRQKKKSQTQNYYDQYRNYLKTGQINNGSTGK